MRVTEDLVNKTTTLDQLPRSHRVVHELSLYSYRIIYEIKPDHIEVLAPIHQRRNLQPEEIYLA
jgi:toxin ParE1/3/4